jgi:cell shape-determining protein MreD
MRAIAAAVLSGVTFDMLAPSNAGFLFIRMACVALAVMFLTSRIFTNRTLIAAATIGCLSAVLDRILLIGFEFVSRTVGRTVFIEDHASIVSSIVWTVLTVMTFFFISAAFSRRFLPILSRVERTSRIPLWKS